MNVEEPLTSHDDRPAETYTGGSLYCGIAINSFHRLLEGACEDDLGWRLREEMWGLQADRHHPFVDASEWVDEYITEIIERVDHT